MQEIQSLHGRNGAGIQAPFGSKVVPLLEIGMVLLLSGFSPWFETPLARNESRPISMPLALTCCQEDVASGGRLEGSVTDESMVEEEHILLTYVIGEETRFEWSKLKLLRLCHVLDPVLLSIKSVWLRTAKGGKASKLCSVQLIEKEFIANSLSVHQLS